MRSRGCDHETGCAPAFRAGECREAYRPMCSCLSPRAWRAQGASFRQGGRMSRKENRSVIMVDNGSAQGTPHPIDVLVAGAGYVGLAVAVAIVHAWAR